jgi:hypothetical protein
MSKPVSISIPHKLGVAEARKRIDEGFDRFGREIGGAMARIYRDWAGDRLNFTAHIMGQAMTGRLDVLAEAVAIEVDLPDMLAALANTVKGRLQKQGQLLLEKK